LKTFNSKFALRTGKAYGCIVAHYLHRDHRHRFALRRINFAGMIDEPGSFSGIISSPKPQRGPEASQRMSLAIFIKGSCQGFPRRRCRKQFHRGPKAPRTCWDAI